MEFSTEKKKPLAGELASNASQELNRKETSRRYESSFSTIFGGSRKRLKR